MREKILGGFALTMALLFVVTIWALLVQFLDVHNVEKATITGGILSMLGGIVGAMGAYFIAVHQINKEKEALEKSDIEANRSFIILDEFSAKPKLRNVITNSESKVLSTSAYEENREKYPDDMIPFYRIRHAGKSELILDCKVEINFDVNMHQSVSNETFYIHLIEKGTEIFIPLNLADEEDVSYPESLKLTYKTMKDETILFDYNVKAGYIKHILLDEVGGQSLMHEMKMQKANWVLPAKLKRNIDVELKNVEF